MRPTDPARERPTGIAVPIRIPARLARLRRRWDTAALAGARAHVTVLFPLAPVGRLGPADRAALATIAQRVDPFEVRFERVRRFDGELVWIEPDAAEPFLRLTADVVDRWPAFPPYGGRFETVIPHLTVVESETAPLESIEAEARAVAPFSARATRMELWRQDDAGRWHQHWVLPFGVRR
ncbi:MAG: 2'-5' RNA ligase family protein [Candidatus Limnocylindrales bacterium]